MNIIKQAKKSLRIAAYRIDDRGSKIQKGILDAILEAKERGVEVTIILEKNTYDHEGTNASNTTALKLLTDKEAPIFDKPNWVAQTHHKMIIVDNQKALLTTGNFDEESFDGDKEHPLGTRDFTVLVKDAAMISEMVRVFDNDTKNIQTTFVNPNLIWGAKNQREKLTALIDTAEAEILIYQQGLSDKGVYQALLNKIKKGVKVKIVMIPFPFGKKKDPNFENQRKLQKAGAQVRFLMDGTFVHAKVLMIDPGTPRQQAYVGSCNFYQPSIDENRELGVVITGDTLIRRLSAVHQADF
ncbi:MAG: hypothetical protein HRU43_06370 [Simkaniaceae bacterium]|nr:hypothetical protein [Simkaniaceae bacterium]